MAEPIIVSTPDVCFGDPRIDGTRITVETIHGWTRMGNTPEQIRDEYPWLTVEQIQAAIDYPLPPEDEDDYLADESDDDLRQMVADLTRERDSLALQLDSCQGALRETLAENSANCDRAEKAERNLDIIATEHDCKEHHYDAKVTRLLNWACPDCFAETRKRAEWLEQQIAENSHSREEIERFRKETIDRAETAEAALAEARQHIAHLEDQLADAETARTLAMGIAERAERERDEAMQALIDRTVEAK